MKAVGGQGAGRWGNYAWVALGLAACNLALFLVVDYGNTYGYDQWVHVYLVSHVHTISYLGRPIGLWPAFLSYPLLHVNQVAYRLVLIFVRSLDAFLLYLLVRQLAPDQPGFALAAGVCLSVFLVPDTYFILTFLESDDNFTVSLVVLLALNIGVAYLLDSRSLWSRRGLKLLLGLLLAAAAVLMREAAAPLLAGVPVLVVLLKRAWSRANLAGVAAWVAVVAGTGAFFVLPLLGLAPANYTTGNFKNLAVGRMLLASVDQMRFAFQNVLFLNFADLYEYRLPALLAAGVAMVVFLMLRARVERPDAIHDRPLPAALLESGAWIVGGLAVVWLGYSAFLPTVLAESPIRTHILSAPGEAVTLASGVWLVSRLGRGARRGRLLQMGGVAFVAVCGAVTTGMSQSALYRYAATWENTAYFLRSLAHLAPQVEPPTLFIYIENPNLEQTPFVYGFDFQYGVRYFYDDQATGLIPTDTVFGEWSVDEAGITMQEQWIDQPHTFGWGEMIFITRDDDARLHILDTLPEQFYTPDRQALYRPAARIRAGFVARRISETFPPVAGPDWSGRRRFLQNEP